MCKMCASIRGKTQHGSHNYAMLKWHYKHLNFIEEKENTFSNSIPLV